MRFHAFAAMGLVTAAILAPGSSQAAEPHGDGLVGHLHLVELGRTSGHELETASHRCCLRG